MFCYKFGKNAKDNHELIKNADQNDWWIHLQDDSSSHAIIEKVNITNNDLDIVCSKLYKKNKLNPTKFIYTQIKNLKIGKKAGEVSFRMKNKVKYFSLF